MPTRGCSAIALVILALTGNADALERFTNSTIQMPSSPPLEGYGFTKALGDLTFEQPVCLVSPPGETNRLFVVERTGRVMVITNLAQPDETVFLDLRSSVASEYWEEGLLGMAFHPDYASNGFFFIYRTLVTSSPASPYGFHDQLSRFSVSQDNPNVAVRESEVIFISQFDFYTHHNAGDIKFGPDGYLYLSLGDDGPGGDDQSDNKQAIEHGLFGGIIRIDVDKRPGNITPNAHPSVTTNYLIPADNPFVGITSYQGIPIDPSKVRMEFYAIGFRNPWRMSFHPVTGDLFVGDVGSGAWEEINRVVKGGNYGWPYIEGTNVSPLLAQAPPGFSSFPPLVTYAHGNRTNEGNAVIGGVAYVGTEIPQLTGAYVFGDYQRGNIWALRPDDTNSPARIEWLTSLVGISCFGSDPRNGDVFGGHFVSGKIYRLAYVPPDQAAPFPRTLAETGVFADLSTLDPNPGIVPYQINHSFWSDHAIKQRWFSLPDPSSTIGFAAKGNWQFPTGAVWIKHFEIELTNGVSTSRRRLETRLLVKNSDGVYGATYRWDPGSTSATLVPAEGFDEELEIHEGDLVRHQTWHYPGRAECRACHTDAGGLALGFNTPQLNREVDYGNGPENQLMALSQAGYFDTNLTSLVGLRSLVVLTNERAGLYDRVKSYFSANCSFCHEPTSLNFFWDARLETRLPDMRLLHSQNTLVTPNSPENSFLLTRMMSRNINNSWAIQMPPLDSNEVDSNAVEIIRRWILGFPRAPWTNQDVGNLDREGSAGINGDLLTVAGSGPGLTGDADRFQFLSQSARGNVQVITRLLSQEAGSGDGQAGLILRQSGDPNSVSAFLGRQISTGARFISRLTPGDMAVTNDYPLDPGMPWFSLQKEGARVTGRVSDDGLAWVELGQATINLENDFQVGVGAAAESELELNTAQFDQFSVLSVTIEIPPSIYGADAPHSIPIRAKVQAVNNGVSRVDFLADGAMLGSAMAEPFDLTWSNAPSGTHLITARVVDLHGLELNSEPITVTLNHPESGVIAMSSDSITQGQWTNRFGAEGFYLVNGSQQLPPQVLLSTSNATAATWSDSTEDARALLDPLQSNRIAARWEATDAFTVSVDLRDGFWHHMTLYFVDWDDAGRRQTITIRDSISGRTIDSYSLSNFAGGIYLQWTIRGLFEIDITNDAGPGAVLSGLFFDPFDNAAPQIVLTGPLTGASSVLPYPIILKADASDADGSVSRVEFYANGLKLGEDVLPPYEFVWSNVWAGAYEIVARAVDELDAKAESAPASLMVRRPLSSAVFCSSDRLTRGDWIGHYGSQGYFIADHATNLPPYATVQPSNTQDYIWAFPGLDATNALLLSNGAGRIASCLFSFSPFEIEMSFDDGLAHQVSLYFLDWDKTARRTAIRVLDPATIAVLDEQTIADFEQGAYLTWSIRGKVTFELTSLMGNAAVSGVFIDAPMSTAPWVTLLAPLDQQRFNLPTSLLLRAEAGDEQNDIQRIEFFEGNRKIGMVAGPPYWMRWNPDRPGDYDITARAIAAPGNVADSYPARVQFISPETPAQVVFHGMDTNTQGNWRGVYGSDGFEIISDAIAWPVAAEVNPSNHTEYVWDYLTSDTRALQRGQGAGRTAACWYDAQSFTVDANLTDGRWHQLALYLLDWDARSRVEDIELVDGFTRQSLDRKTVTDFAGGVYLLWDVRGSVRIKFTAQQDTPVVSGLFLQPLTPLRQWQRLHFSPEELQEGYLSADDADPEGDGVPNLLEFKMGRDPRMNDPEPLFTYAVENDLFVVRWHAAPNTDDVSVRVEVSTDLVHWTSGDAVTEPPLIQVDSSHDTFTVRMRTSVVDAAYQFVRLVAVRNEF